MRTTLRCLGVCSLVAFGYVLGTMQFFAPEPVQAQAPKAETARDKIRAGYKLLEEAQQMLGQQSKHKSATEGVNSFAVMSGGIDAVRDLEEGRGVDPETFAALYAGEATEEVKKSLRMDDSKQQLTYKGRVIRLYSIDRLKKLYRQRNDIAGIKKKIPSKIKQLP